MTEQGTEVGVVSFLYSSPEWRAWVMNDLGQFKLAVTLPSQATTGLTFLAQLFQCLLQLTVKKVHHCSDTGGRSHHHITLQERDAYQLKRVCLIPL